MRADRTSSTPDDAEGTRTRLGVLSLAVAGMFVLLFARLWFLQVMVGERYSTLAEGNAVRTFALEAPRGRILDRDGDALVDTRFGLVVSVQPSELGEAAEVVLDDLADLLGISREELDRRIEQSPDSPYRPRRVAFDVPEAIAFYLNEHRATRYPGVYAETLPLRHHPHGSLAAHVVGRLGQISAADLDSERFADRRPGDLIGLTGVERTYEEVLRGVEGERRLEVNARGEAVRSLAERLPEAGGDVHLALDADLQRVAEQALAEGIHEARGLTDEDDGPGRGGTFRAPAGALVALDPRDGSVRAMASFPSYDPERFVGGVSQEYWDLLHDEASSAPLLNRVVQASYPPGSVFKVVSAAAALEHGYLDVGQELPCPGEWEWNGSVYRNWTRAPSEPMDLAESLVHSCDTVYYELARRMWTDEQASGAAVELLSGQAEAWGLGTTTKVDLPGERAGVVPGRAWKASFWERNRARYCEQARTSEPGSYAERLFTELCSERGRVWRGGDAVNLSIGQGDLQTTPLQVANAYAAIANGGTLYRPRVAERVVHRDGTVDELAPQVLGSLPVDPAYLTAIRQGLEGVTAPGGTAAAVFSDFPVKIAGKTGTAELKPRQPFAWFAGYNAAPVDGEQLVVVAVVEEGGGGSQTAAPIVRRVFEWLVGPPHAELGAP